MKRSGKWHIENKPIAYKLTGGKCDKCGHIGKFSIHHKHYNNLERQSIYDYTFLELYDMDIVEVLCHLCHKKEHNGDNILPCSFCGRSAELTRSKTLNIDYPICRKCFKQKGGIKGNFNVLNNQTKLF